MDSFSDWLMKQLAARHMTQSDLAHKSGLDTGTISNAMNGKVGPKVCRDIASGLGLPQRVVFIAAGLMDDEQIGEISPKIQHIIDLLGKVNDEVLDLVSDQIELVLIPHGEKVTGRRHASHK